MFDPILHDLTAPQREAVTHVDGPMLVVAGAGSGKTRVVTRRIAYLVHCGIRPHQILALTFTNKAAREMQHRVETLVGAAPRWVGTFHSACARFLRFDLERLNEGRSGRFSIYDTDDQKGLIRQILKDQRIDDKRFKPPVVLSRISRAKCDGDGPEAIADGSWDGDVIARVFEAYEKRLRETNAVDFDDLLLLTVRMLKNVPGLREEYQRRFPYVLVDEYQDTNRVQYALMRLLTGQKANVHVTGDPDQSIYSWRGAEYRNIMDFQKDFPQARLVRLEQNYRSTKTILAAANALIRNNAERIDKDLFTENPQGEKVIVAALPSDRDEARWVVARAAELMQAGQSLRGMSVFYRTNAQSRSLEEALISSGLPYQIVGGIRFYERKEIKDLLAHLKVLVNPRDDVSLLRVLDARATGVGPKTLDLVRHAAIETGRSTWEQLATGLLPPSFQGRRGKKLDHFLAWCRKLAAIPHQPVGDCVRQVLDQSGLAFEIESKADRDPAADDRVENLEQFVNRAAEFEARNPDADLAAFLEDVALVADVDAWDPETEAISLMTLHSAKGLEFPVVFLVGLEQGLLPHQNAKNDFAVEEERRLFYVGLTRAQQRAFVSHASVRMLWGSMNVSAPSIFLRELPPEQIEEVDLADPFAAPGAHGVAPHGGSPAKTRLPWADVDADLDFDPGDDFHLSDEDIMAETPRRPASRAPQPRRAPAPPRSRIPTPPPGRVRSGRAMVDLPAPAGDGFRVGDHVEHATFGRGKVLSVSAKQIMVQFFVGGVKLLHLDVAKLRRV